jgi:hypothetical protein
MNSARGASCYFAFVREAIRSSFFRADAVFPVRGDEPEEGCDENEFDGEMEAVEDFFEAGISVPRRSELHADPGECVAPGPGADESVDVEAELVHLRDACGKGDEGADDRQHSADENGDGAEAVEEVIDTIQVVAAEEEIAAVALDHGTTAVCADPVGGDGAEVGGEGGDGREDDEVPLRVRESVAGERHDDFRGDGDTGGLDRHEKDDAEVSAGRNGADEEGDDFF